MLKRLLILALVPFLFCSCNKSDVEEITFSSWGSVTEVKILNDLINDFEKDNPQIKINFMHIPQNYFQKIHLLFASSTPPDVVFINNMYLPVYADKFEDLTEYINSDEYYSQSIQALSVDGKLLAVPRDISNLVFYYNKNIVKNIDKDWTFEDFIKLLPSINNEKYWSVSYERDIYWASPYTTTLGFEKGMDFYKKLEGVYAPLPENIGSATLGEMFLDGKIALYLSGRWMYPKINEKANFPYGIVTFPGTTTADSSGWAITKGSKHKESALIFVKYLSSKKSIDYFTETGLIVPARLDSSKLIKEKAFIDAANKSKAIQYGRNYNKEKDKLNKFYWN